MFKVAKQQISSVYTFTVSERHNHNKMGRFLCLS